MLIFDRTKAIIMIGKSLMAATTRPLILSILSEGESYGYAIIQRVKQLSGGHLIWADGMLYPVLHKLEKEKLIRSHWRVSDGKKMRKYYAITEDGLEALETERKFPKQFDLFEHGQIVDIRKFHSNRSNFK